MVPSRASNGHNVLRLGMAPLCPGNGELQIQAHPSTENRWLLGLGMTCYIHLAGALLVAGCTEAGKRNACFVSLFFSIQVFKGYLCSCANSGRCGNWWSIHHLCWGVLNAQVKTVGVEGQRQQLWLQVPYRQKDCTSFRANEILAQDFTVFILILHLIFHNFIFHNFR